MRLTMPCTVAICTAVSVSGLFSIEFFDAKNIGKTRMLSIRVSLKALAACSPNADRSTRNNTRRNV